VQPIVQTRDVPDSRSNVSIAKTIERRTQNVQRDDITCSPWPRQRDSASGSPPRAFYEIVSKPLELVLFPTMHMYSSCIFVHVAWFCSSKPLGHENSFHMAQFSRGRLGR